MTTITEPSETTVRPVGHFWAWQTSRRAQQFAQECRTAMVSAGLAKPSGAAAPRRAWYSVKTATHSFWRDRDSPRNSQEAKGFFPRAKVGTRGCEIWATSLIWTDWWILEKFRLFKRISHPESQASQNREQILLNTCTYTPHSYPLERNRNISFSWHFFPSFHGLLTHWFLLSLA